MSGSSGFTFAVPKSIEEKMAAEKWESDRKYHESLVSSADSPDAVDRQHNVHHEEIRNTPLFSADVLKNVDRIRPEPISDPLPQYGFLAKILDTFGGQDQKDEDELPDLGDSRLFVNMAAPWSAFICGSQGSGKSHTLSCMLEASLKPSGLGVLPKPLAGMVFHYDKFTGFSASQICEAAYLSSESISVTVLVSPSNFYRMKEAYETMKGLPPGAPKPVVAPLLLEEKHLNIQRMLKLMAIDEKEGKISLYMEVSDGSEPCQ